MSWRTRHGGRLVGAVAATLLLLTVGAGCSALGLSSFEVGRCVVSDDCDGVNNRNRVPADACQRFVCVRPRNTAGELVGDYGSCIRGTRDDDADGVPNILCAADGTQADCNDDDASVAAGLAEVCDGLDNDCDGVVDNDVSPFAESGRLVHPGLSGAAAFSSGLTSALVGSSDARFFAPLPEAGTATSVAARYVQHVGPTEAEARVCTPPRSGTISQTTLVAGCPAYRPTAPPGEPPVTAGSCDLGETAVAESALGYVVASVNGRGCAAGQLRVGLVASGDAGDIELRGPVGRSNLWLGVDLAADGCTGTGASRGAAGVALDTVADGSRGLVAFIGAAAGRACGSAPAPLRVMGVIRQSASAGATSIEVLNGTNDGIPATLAMTTLSGPPGLAHIPDGATTPSSDFVLAYGTPDGALVLSRVSMTVGAPVLPRLADEAADACVVDEPVLTGDLAAASSLASIAGAGPVEAAAVAVVPTNDEATSLDIGVVFQRGCGATAQVFFAMVRPDGMVSTPVALGMGTEPAVAGLPNGFVVEGYRRGTAVAGPASTGGFVVGYRTGAGYRTVRVAAFDGLPLESTEETIPGATAARLVARANQIDIASVASDGVRLGGATCAP